MEIVSMRIRRCVTFLCFALGFALGAAPVVALEEPIAPLAGDDWLRIAAHLSARHNETVAGVKQELLAKFISADVLGGGVTPESIELAWKFELASRKARKARYLLEHDVNGDIKLTLAEMARWGSSGSATSSGLVYDLNKDGVTTMAEVEADAKAELLGEQTFQHYGPPFTHRA